MRRNIVYTTTKSRYTHPTQFPTNNLISALLQAIASVSVKKVIMLRRPATAIRLTPEDIMEYDNSVSSNSDASVYQQDANDSSKQLLGIFKEPSSRNERMGVDKNERRQFSN